MQPCRLSGHSCLESLGLGPRQQGHRRIALVPPIPCGACCSHDALGTCHPFQWVTPGSLATLAQPAGAVEHALQLLHGLRLVLCAYVRVLRGAMCVFVLGLGHLVNSCLKSSNCPIKSKISKLFGRFFVQFWGLAQRTLHWQFYTVQVPLFMHSLLNLNA